MASEGKKRQGVAQPKGCWIVKERRLGIYLRDGFTCQYCGRDLHGAAPADVTLDHLIPRCEGGDNGNTNLVTACKSCNSARGSKPWVDYATGGAVERILLQQCALVNIPLAKAIIAGTANEELEETR